MDGQQRVAVATDASLNAASLPLNVYGLAAVSRQTRRLTKGMADGSNPLFVVLTTGWIVRRVAGRAALADPLLLVRF